MSDSYDPEKVVASIGGKIIEGYSLDSVIVKKLEPWEECPDVWATKSQYFTWVRGQLRQLWSDYPVRVTFKNENVRDVTEEERENKVFNHATKFVGQCVFCEGWMAKSKLEVDHKTPSDGCTNYEEAEQFLWYCGRAEKKDMQLTCKPCHKIKTYSELHDMGFADARIEKLVIVIIKDKNLKHILLTDFDFTESQVSNPDKRRAIVRDLIKSGRMK